MKRFPGVKETAWQIRGTSFWGVDVIWPAYFHLCRFLRLMRRGFSLWIVIYRVMNEKPRYFQLPTCHWYQHVASSQCVWLQVHLPSWICLIKTGAEVGSKYASRVNPFASFATYSFTCVSFHATVCARSPQQGSNNNAALPDHDSIQIIPTKLSSQEQRAGCHVIHDGDWKICTWLLCSCVCVCVFWGFFCLHWQSQEGHDEPSKHYLTQRKVNKYLHFKCKKKQKDKPHEHIHSKSMRALARVSCCCLEFRGAPLVAWSPHAGVDDWCQVKPVKLCFAPVELLSGGVMNHIVLFCTIWTCTLRFTQHARAAISFLSRLQDPGGLLGVPAIGSIEAGTMSGAFCITSVSLNDVADTVIPRLPDLRLRIDPVNNLAFTCRH